MVPPQSAVERAPLVGRPRTVQRLVEDAGQERPHLSDRQRRGPDFSPAWLPALGTRSPTALRSCVDANPPTSSLVSPLGRPLPWRRANILRPGASPLALGLTPRAAGHTAGRPVG